MKHLLMAAILAAAPAVMADELDQDTPTASPVPAEQLAKAKDLPATTVIRISKKDPSQIEVVHLKEPLKAGQKLKNLAFEKIALNAEKTGVAFTAENELDASSSTSSWVFAAGRGRRPYYGYAGYRPYRGYGRYYGGYGYNNAPNYGYGNDFYYGNQYYGNQYSGDQYYGDQSYGNQYYGDQYYGNNQQPYGLDGQMTEYQPGPYGPEWNSYNGGVGSSEYQKNGCMTNYSCPQAYYPEYRYAGYNYNYAPYYMYSDANYNYAYTGWRY